MTRLGKILVFFQVGMSLLCASWAFALWSNHVDWTAQKGKGTTPDGELVGRMKEYDDLAKASIRPATARWRDSRGQLETQEWWRPAERIWYAQQLRILRGDEAAPAILQLARGNDGTVVMDPNYGRGSNNVLQMLPTPLKPLSFYETQIKGAIVRLGETTEQLKKEADRDTAATKQLNGPKGLHARLQFERHKLDAVIAEYKAIRPKWLNAAVELKELEELRQRLDRRIEELTTNKVARRP